MKSPIIIALYADNLLISSKRLKAMKRVRAELS